MNKEKIYRPGAVIAGTNSGCGKTTVSLALMAWLVRQGYTVSPFKIGPDFIDPGHHKRITGRDSRNLDGWMLDKAYNQKLFREEMQNSDACVVEGVMGLFDGYSGKDESGSTSQMAKWLDLPVVLVVNARSMARSAAALVQGFENFDPDLNFAGVIFNQLGSGSHLQYLIDAMKTSVRMPCLGGILRDDRIEIPERHLGLVTGDEHVLKESDLDHLAGIIDQRIDTEMIFKEIKPQSFKVPLTPQKKATVKIGVARDKAFCFYYQDNFDILEKLGAELVFFSPILDNELPKGLDALYLGGGYPEVFAGLLSSNTAMLEDIRQASQKGMPVYAECGGFMYLCRSITDQENNRLRMVGCFPFNARMKNSMAAMGYRQIRMARDTIIGKKDMVVRGHEFHYSEIEIESCETADRVYLVAQRSGAASQSEGYQQYNTLGSYIHLHFGSNPDCCRQFIKSAQEYKDKSPGAG